MNKERDERLLPLPKEIQEYELTSRYYPSYGGSTELVEQRFDPREYLIIIYKRLPMIIALVVIVTSLVAFYMYRQPSIYEARAVLLIEPRRPKIQSKDTININFGYDMNYYNTQEKLLESPELIKEAVIKLGLYRNPELFKGQGRGVIASIKSLFSGGSDEPSKTQSLPVLSENNDEGFSSEEIKLSPEERLRVERITASLAGSVDAIQEERTNLFSVKVVHTNPELAARLANAIVGVYIDRAARREVEGTRKSLEDLTKSIEELKENIAQLEQQRIEEMKSSGLPLAEKGQELAASILEQKSTEWLKAEAERRAIEQQYRTAVEAAKKGEILSVASDNKFIITAREQQLKLKKDSEARLEDIEGQIEKAEKEKAALLARYTEEHPSVKQIEAQIQQLRETKEKVKNEVEKKLELESKLLEQRAQKELLTALSAQLNAAKQKEEQARASYLAEVERSNQQGQAGMRLKTLTQAIDTNRELLNTYIQRQKELELAISSSRPDNISIATEATKPDAPIGPQRNRNILLAFLASLFVGIGLAFLFDYLDDSVRTVDDVTKHLGLPTLAIIPEATASKKTKLLPAGEKEQSSSVALVTLSSKQSPLAEAFRHLRTSLLFSSAGKPPQTILITSSQPAEGKTTTAINTAIALAQSGADVVLIDCDLRRPRIHEHLSLSNKTGLTNYLSGDQSLEGLLKPIPELPNLKVITSGPIPPNPAELLGSDEMKALLNFLKTNFKHVILDSPPAISFADAAILSTIVDGVVIVAMSGKSSMNLMKRFKQRLISIGARIYGVVLNGVKPSSLEYSYYGYYYGYYGYYGSSEKDDDVFEEKNGKEG
ncbi:MAG: chain-length determining protein [Pyrinomonadaceae bacterium]|jgi:capsular exopolysaccharide synthesis family protein|nr:MAG: chain-length determining protein [Pyrinomonadaceae bacterium]